MRHNYRILLKINIKTQCLRDCSGERAARPAGQREAGGLRGEQAAAGHRVRHGAQVRRRHAALDGAGGHQRGRLRTESRRLVGTVLFENNHFRSFIL